ncbi:MAG: prephenate dehydrogenase/arogenate dehydrogenase family protein [Pseudomonadota bacterium]|nr:prephenate dehydrogenase/arogenate dehydrogenase family protein [Pseudomonadota bacterium]
MIYKTIYIFGLGMIGGSLALSIKKNKISKKIFAYDKDKKNLVFAKNKGLIDDYDNKNFKYLEQADLIIISTPISAYKSVLKRIKKFKNKNCIITDVGSTKTSILNDIDDIFGEEQKCFVGSHPLAGKEKSGVKNASLNLFLNATVIITPTKETDRPALSQVRKVWKKIGCRIEILNPFLHDIIMSETSHVPHLVSYSLVNSICNNKNVKNIHNFTGGGFKDFARIAKSDPTMWRDICKYNKKNIIAFLNVFVNNLKSLKSQIHQNNFQKLYSFFKKTRRKLS